MRVKSLFIVGHFEDDIFKQITPYSGYTGTRLFKRLKYAQDFLRAGYSPEENKIYQITEVEELDASKYEF